MDEVKQRHLVTSWQGFLQQIHYLMNRTYREYSYFRLPEKKQDSWRKIDAKIIAKYGTNLSKHQRNRRKLKGLSNYMYIRWESHGILLRPSGQHTGSAGQGEFLDVRVVPLVLPLLEQATFVLSRGREAKGITVTFSRETFLGFKATFVMAMKSVGKGTAENVRARIIEEFNRLNGFPAYYGLIVQKMRLREVVLCEGKKHGIDIKETNLRIRRSLKKIPVFS